MRAIQSIIYTYLILFFALVAIVQCQDAAAAVTDHGVVDEDSPNPKLIHKSQMPIEHRRGEEELDALEAQIRHMESDEYIAVHASMDHDMEAYEEYMRSMESDTYDGNEL